MQLKEYALPSDSLSKEKWRSERITPPPPYNTPSDAPIARHPELLPPYHSCKTPSNVPIAGHPELLPPTLIAKHLVTHLLLAILSNYPPPSLQNT